MSDILEFGSPYGNGQLNFGGDDSQNLVTFSKDIKLNYSIFPYFYIELNRTFETNKNLLRYVKIKVKSSSGAILAKASSIYLKKEIDGIESLFVDTLPYKSSDNIYITIQFLIEQVETTLDNLGFKDLKIFIGKENDLPNRK